MKKGERRRKPRVDGPLLAQLPRVSAFANPLKVFTLSSYGHRPRNPAIDQNAVLNDFTYPLWKDDPIEVMHQRYMAITPREEGQWWTLVVPHDQRLLETLVWPLRHAKISYVLGHFLGTIALCGLVGEMSAIFLFELEGAASELRRFEQRGQEDRISVLSSCGLIDAVLRGHLERVRMTRRKYLHFRSQSHKALEADARRIYGDANAAMSLVIGQTTSKGKLVLRPSFRRYFEQRAPATR